MKTKLSVWTGVAAILALAVFAPSAQAQGTVVGSKHDLSSNLGTSQRVCVFCHTPHQPEGPPQIDYDPLWNHTLSGTAAYGVYDSPTFDGSGTIADIGPAPVEVSNLCMSCHDGTVGIGSLYNNPNIAAGEETPTNSATMMAGNANMGTDLSNDHPVNFTYDTALVTADAAGGPPGLEDPATNATVAGLLFTGTVQCASCHDPHDPTNLPFLRVTAVNSQLCTTCHIK